MRRLRDPDRQTCARDSMLENLFPEPMVDLVLVT
jgi:hypothetical protein